jgi:O-antigen/teichoic acid export membrane protein
MKSSSRLQGLTKRSRAAIALNRSLLANAGSMVGTSLVTSVLGLAFWVLAAHHFDQRSVGVASAATSAMILLGFTGTLGLGTLLMGDLPQRAAGHRSLVNAALVVAAAAGGALGLAFAAIAPAVSSSLEPLRETWPAMLCFAAGAGLTSLAFVLDQALIGLLRGGLQLVRNGVFALVKLLALIAVTVLVANAGAAWIYSAWTMGIALSLVVLTRFYRRRGEDAMRPDFRLLHGMRGSAASHAAVNLALETADLAMPILVVMLLSAKANASFYMAWMIAGFLVMVPLALSMVLYAIGSGSSSRLTERFRFSVGASLAFGLVANLVLLPGAAPALRLFGASYADQATSILHIMALGVFPLTIKTHYVAIHRMQRRLRVALPVVWAGTLLELGGGGLGAVLGGLQGVAWGWLAGLIVEALVMGRDVLRGVRADGVDQLDAEPVEEPTLLAGLDTASVERL